MIRKTKDFPARGDHNEPSIEYEIGYGRPPAHGRFKPGQSGNPKGSSKRRRKVRTVIEEALDQKIKIRERDRSRSVSKLDAIVITMVGSAGRCQGADQLYRAASISRLNLRDA